MTTEVTENTPAGQAEVEEWEQGELYGAAPRGKMEQTGWEPRDQGRASRGQA